MTTTTTTPTPEPVPTPAEVVDRFIRAIEARDVHTALGLLTDDISYENVPIDPIVGKEATAAALRAFLEPATEVEWRITRQHAVGNLVVNERLDRFQIGDGWLELPVAGFFELADDGRIRRWRDYFDMTTYSGQLQELVGT